MPFWLNKRKLLIKIKFLTVKQFLKFYTYVIRSRIICWYGRNKNVFFFSFSLNSIVSFQSGSFQACISKIFKFEAVTNLVVL